MSYTLRLTRQANDDLLRLFEFLAEKNYPAAKRAILAIDQAWSIIEESPFSCRKAEEHGSSLHRELIIPFGKAGYVALFEIESDNIVTVLAVRHQREQDYY